MRTILKNNQRTKRKLAKLPKVFLIGCWARFGIREYPYAGKTTKAGIPYVYDYRDCNGTCDEFVKVPLTNVTTGWVYAWTTSKAYAEKLANAMNFGERDDYAGV